MDTQRIEKLFRGVGGVAMFVDLDNLVGGLQSEGMTNPLEKASIAVLTLRSLLKSNNFQLLIGRAYGAWNNSASASVSRRFQKAGITPVPVLVVGGKNSADLELSLDAQKTLLENDKVTHFVIFSGDRDFIPLARRIRERGKEVVIVGSQSAMSGDLLELVGEDNYINLNELLDLPREQKVTPPLFSPEDPLKEKVFKLLLNAERMRGKEIWIGPFLRNCEQFLPQVTSDDVKNAIDCLKDEGRIQVEKRPDGLNPAKFYSVIIITTPRTGTMTFALRQAGLVI